MATALWIQTIAFQAEKQLKTMLFFKQKSIVYFVVDGQVQILTSLPPKNHTDFIHSLLQIHRNDLAMNIYA